MIENRKKGGKLCSRSAYLGQSKSIKQTTGIQNLDVESYLDTYIYVPKKFEQTQIANYLDDKTQKIDALVAKSKQAIDLLQEKRTALISAAVTGKIDVRNWQGQAQPEQQPNKAAVTA